MKVLVTGAKGFVGRNLVEALKCIRDGKDRRDRYQSLLPLTIFEYDLESTVEELDQYCSEANFVFNLAGVNRPKTEGEFVTGNSVFVADLLGLLEKHENKCPVMLASSVQATLEGRYANSEYGRSKLAGEISLREYADRTGAKALIYRFPNLYGKWCRPNYNSVVATFCHNIANGLPVTVNDPSVQLELLYIDDLVEEMLSALIGEASEKGDGFCYASPTDLITVGQIADLLQSFKADREALRVSSTAENTFTKKLHSTYLTYLSPADFSYNLKMNCDERGSFTEILKTPERGQVSVNVSKPGIAKGQHWHHSKWEKFCVVSGEALIKMRRVGCDVDGDPFPVIEYRVSSDVLTVVEMIPGYTHSIENLSSTQDLVTLMWANELFDPARPDTYYEEV